MKLRIILLFFVILFSFSLVSSKAVCGDVFTNEEMVPSWFEVEIYSLENASFQKDCVVSPDQYKYCCSIEGSGWNAGDFFEARILDNVSGYIAKPVKMELTNFPYDIFPTLFLEDLIKFKSPLVHFNISFLNSTYFEIFYLEDSENFSFESEQIILNNNSYSSFVEVDFGSNSFFATSYYEGFLFSEELNYFLLEELNFSRSIDCEGCKKNRIRRGEEVSVSLDYGFSNNVSSLKVYEHVPYDWEILNSTGEVYYNGGDYQVISWEIEGDSFIGEYSFLPLGDSESEVFFKNYIEEIEVDFQKYKLYKFVPPVFSGSSREKNSGNHIPLSFSKVSDSYPIISENDSLLLALYSEEFSNEGSFDILKINFTDKIYNRSLKVIEAYELYTNLGSNFGRLSLELSLNDSILEDGSYGEYLVYGVDPKKGFVKLTGKMIGEGENIKFLVDSEEFFKEVVVFGVKSKLTLWDKIVQGYWNFFGFRTGVI